MFSVTCISDDKQFECDLCNKRYKSLKDRNYHKQTVHLGRYRYSCSVCGKGLHSATRYSTHKCNWGAKRKEKAAKKALASADKLSRKSAGARAEPTICGRWNSKKKVAGKAGKQKSQSDMKVQMGQSQVVVEDGSMAYLVAFWDDKGELIVQPPGEDGTAQD